MQARALGTLVGAAFVLTTAIAHGHELEGQASWYGGKFQGRLTANGEVFDTGQLTAAHKTLPFGTIVEVVNLENDLIVRVRINDRGPFVEGRIIDLSRAAADVIEMTGAGVAAVRLVIVSMPEPPSGSVQVASFSVHGSAAELADRLRREGLAATVESAQVNGSAVHRVVVADVAPAEVAATVETLGALGFPDVFVRSR
jgi:rare lipoprotein A